MNEILLRRKNKVILEKGTETNFNPQYIATLMKNVESLGYIFSEELYNVLKTLNRVQLQEFYLELIPVLKKMVGADVTYLPMYPNFPGSVMGADSANLYINAIIHYWSNGELYPVEHKDERLPLFDTTKAKVIGLGTYDDLRNIFKNLCGSKTSISQVDKEDLQWIFKNVSFLKFPEEIPLKENAALIGKLYLEEYSSVTAKDIQRYFKTATDVLRLITAMSDGDISLATNTKFRSFKRKERRLLMELLMGCGDIEEDMQRYKNRWIRVGERLHPTEYNREQFGKVITAFNKLRNGEKIETYAGKVEKAIEEEDYKLALNLLKKRPGELARRLDYLLRTIPDSLKLSVILTFKEVANKVSTPVLLQVKEHFAHRAERLDSRVFFPKGSLARCYSITNELPDIEESCCKMVAEICESALVENYKDRGLLGTVYLSEEYKNYVVPFSQRSASKALKTLTRGSRLPIPENINALRAFIWWTNMDNSDNHRSRVDIDLTAAIFDENWGLMEHVSYTKLRSSKYKTCHSGDIVNGGPVDGEGVSEFLDVDIDAIVEHGARYVVYQVYNFTGQKYSDMPHAMFGWMGREDVNSGEIYEPTTVEQKMDLTSQSIVSIPVIFDCVTREVIWCDMNLTINGCHVNRGGNNIESNLTGVEATCYSIVNMKKPNLYDLLEMHIKARGLRVESKQDADVVFDFDGDVTPFDIDVIMAEYL